MATWKVYGTSVNLNNVMTTGTHFDKLEIYNGGTVIVNTSPKYAISGIEALDGHVFIDGVGATSIISMVIRDYVYLQTPASTFKTSLGWTTLGTAAGTADQVLPLTEYFFNTSGGSTMCNLQAQISGLWIESGQTIPFTGGTGTLPLVDDYLYTIPYNGGTNWAPILSVGTSPGDPTTGTLTTKWFSGTFLPNTQIEIRKVIDNQGKVFDTSWKGTSGTPSLAPGTLAKWSNFHNPAYNNALTQYAIGDDVFSRAFVQDIRKTTGTFGNGVNGVIPQAGALIKSPNIRLLHCSAFNNLITGTATTALTQFGFDMSAGAGATFDLKGVMFDNYIVGPGNGAGGYTNFAGTTIALHKMKANYNLAYLKSFEIHDVIISQLTAVQPMEINFPYCSAIFDDIYYVGNFNIAPWYSNFYSSVGLTLKNSTIAAFRDFTNAAESYIDMGLSTLPSLTLTNCILRGRIGLDSANKIISKIKWIGSKTNNYTTFNMRNVGGGNLSMEDIQDIYSNNSINHTTVPSDWVGYSGIIELRAIGHKVDKTHRANSTIIDGYTANKTCSIHRCFSRADTIVGFTGAPTDNTDPNDYFHMYNCSIGTNVNLHYLYNREHFRFRGLSQSYSETGDLPIMLYGSIDGGLTVGPVMYDYFNNYTGTSGQIVFQNLNTTPSLNLYSNYTYATKGTSNKGIYNTADATKQNVVSAGCVATYEMDYFALGHTGFTGVVTFSDASRAIGGSDWTNGTCKVEFQYDTSGEGGTGFNGSWLYARTPSNWTGISVNPSIGVKLKYQFTAYSTDAYRVKAFGAQTTIAPNYYDYLYPVDQVMTTITLTNVVIGSSYYIYNSTKAILLTSGVASATTVTYSISSTSAADGDTILIRVRKSSGSPKYIPYESNALVADNIVNVYVSQIADTIAS
jgi:hypothetical protein